jgi:hypothetical protein
MSTLGDVLKGIRDAVVMDERVRALSDKVDAMDARQTDTRERLVRLETMLGMLRPTRFQRGLPPES